MHNKGGTARLRVAGDGEASQRRPSLALFAGGAINSRCAGIILIILGVTSSMMSFAQDPPAAPQQTRPAEPATPGPAKTPDDRPQETRPAGQNNPSVATQAGSVARKPVALFNLLERKSIVFPDIAYSTTALTARQKSQLFVDNSISAHTVLWSTLGSLVGQATDSPTGYGVSGHGYAKRLGSSLARGASGEFFGTFVIASALHQDPRFFPEYNPTLTHAMKYSLQRVFVTRNDAGKDVVNAPGLLGPLLGESLANAYWPDRNRTAGDTFFRYGLDLASRAAGNMLREYWPVLSARMRHVPPQRGAPH